MAVALSASKGFLEESLCHHRSLGRFELYWRRKLSSNLLGSVPEACEFNRRKRDEHKGKNQELVCVQCACIQNSATCLRREKNFLDPL